MKTAMIVKMGFTAVACLLISTASNAQSAPAGRTSQPTIKPRDAQSGMASGKYQRKNGSIQSADYGRTAKGGAHAAQSPSSSQEVKKGENPLYEDGGKSGSNPMYEGSRIHSQANGSGHQPGRSEGVKGAPLKGAATSSIPADQRRKHLAGVKYEDREAAGQPANSPHKH